MKSSTNSGHAAAIITIFIWGTTFISTKVLLSSFSPIEILFFRFILGLTALIIIYPKRLSGTTVKQEMTFAGAGFCGITLYYLLENIALTYTQASNVGVIISSAPFFTVILSFIISKREEKPTVGFFAGFITAIAGICLISFGNSSVKINPVGDVLALAASLLWAVYSLLTKKISSFGFNTIQTTRRIFLYGIIFMIPALFIFDFRLNLPRFASTSNLANIIFLGIGASALCFVTWNFAVKKLGAVKTSIYIYTVPVITLAASALILKEKLTVCSLTGTALTLSGLLLSEIKNRKRGKRKNEY